MNVERKKKRLTPEHREHMDRQLRQWIDARSSPEGWGLADTERGGVGVQRDESMGIFTSNKALLLHLHARFDRGEELANRAVDYICKHNYEEYERIRTFWLGACDD